VSPLGLVFVTWGGLVVAATVAALSPWHLPQPELGLLIVLYLGLLGRSETVPQLVAAMCIGYLADLFAAAPRGLHVLTFGMVLLGARAASSRLMVSSRWQVMVVAFLAALGHGALIIGLTASMYGDEAVRALGLLPRAAGMTCLLAPLVFGALEWLERRLRRRFGGEAGRLGSAG
jgi:cell shape-determining protein MreD